MSLLNNKWRLTLLVSICLALVTVLALISVFLIDVKDIQVTQSPTDEPSRSREVAWRSSVEICAALGDDWQLPSLVELFALYYRRGDIEWIDQTDYWSRNSMSGFAFGLNTGWGIPSFDRHDDTDHYWCVR